MKPGVTCLLLSSLLLLGATCTLCDPRTLPGLSSEDRHIAYLALTRPTGYYAEGRPFRAPYPGVNSWVEAQTLTSAPESHRTTV